MGVMMKFGENKFRKIFSIQFRIRPAMNFSAYKNTKYKGSKIYYTIIL